MSGMTPRWVKRFMAVGTLLVAWQLTSWVVSAWPAPAQVIGTLITYAQDPVFQAALLGSARRMVTGYLLVMVIGLGGGLLLGRFPLLDQLAGSVAVAIHAIPGAAWVPLAILWFGMTEQAVVFTILLGAAGIVMVSTDTGVREVPPLMSRAAKTLGARGVNYFWFVVVPAAIPKIVDGLRLAWAFGWRALMAGELLTSVNGLGHWLNQVAKAGQLDRLLAMMLLIALIGLFVDGLIFKRLERAVRVRWGLTEPVISDQRSVTSERRHSKMPSQTPAVPERGIRLPRALCEEMLAQCRREYPKEACGMLAGSGGVVRQVYPMRNVDESPISYAMDPLEQLRVMKRMRAQGEELLAIYHSHTASAAYPSPVDVKLATYPEVSYVLVSLKDQAAPAVRGFRIQDGTITEHEMRIEE